jgi:RNA recognition motif. (a.k.a. RRM, RBD, or RNP domain)
MVHENHCAFVNFENPRAAGRAMRDLQGLVVEGVKLLLRYPNRFLGGDHSVKLRDTTPVLPGRPKRGGPQVTNTSPKRPIKKHSK